ncbi:MAG: CehA/McbA family metallohydrolase [Candidatus Berkelbacteria bacterium]
MHKRGVKKLENYIGLGSADVHIHSNFSDGRPTIEQILEYVQNYTDLDVIAITDHDTIEGAQLAVKIAENNNYRFDVVVGEEISSKHGHILGLFLKEAIKPGHSAHTTLEQIHKQGGVAIPSHPFMHTNFNDPTQATMDGIGAKQLISNKYLIDAVEVVNGTPTLADENLAASALNKTMLFRGETGGSDAHIVEAIGRAYTVFEGKTAADLKRALKNHQTKAIYGTWSVLALIKYLFFYIPLGLRLTWHTLIRDLGL